MTINRRDVLKAGSVLALTATLPALARGQAPAPAVSFNPVPGNWRTHEITAALEIADRAKGVQCWVPVPAFAADDWMRPGTTSWNMSSGQARIVQDERSGASMLHAVWPAGTDAAKLTVTSRFSGRDRRVDLEQTASDTRLDDRQRQRYTAPTELIPLDGIVKTTADGIVAGATSDLDRARRIYAWIVDNTFRDPKTRGCGVGDIASMLHMGNLGGKCADLNALYVGLARAAGLPARDIYGIRVAASAFGYKSLGANTTSITKAQHCRAEVHIAGIGWVPADPADVRKVVLEEPPGNLAVADPKVAAARATLFGAWETNWLAYNDAHDVTLPGSSGPTVPFLMYPQAETAAGRLDCLDPDAFKYAISAREIET